GLASSRVSLRCGVVGAGDGFARPVRVWNVPPPHEDNRLSWPDRQAIRRASDDTELEHNSCDPANFEGSEEHAIAGDLAHPCRASMSAMAIFRQQRLRAGFRVGIARQ